MSRRRLKRPQLVTERQGWKTSQRRMSELCSLFAEFVLVNGFWKNCCSQQSPQHAVAESCGLCWSWYVVILRGLFPWTFRVTTSTAQSVVTTEAEVRQSKDRAVAACVTLSWPAVWNFNWPKTMQCVVRGTFQSANLMKTEEHSHCVKWIVWNHTSRHVSSYRNRMSSFKSR